MRCVLVCVLLIGSLQSAVALDADCNKVRDLKNTIRVTSDELKTTFERTGEAKKQTQERTIRVSRASDPMRTEIYGADGRRTAISYSSNGRPTSMTYETEKGSRRTHWSYAEEIDSVPYLARKDFQSRFLTTAYASDDDKEGKREGNVVLHKFIGEQSATVGKCSYKVLVYESKSYRFVENAIPSLMESATHYSPELKVSLYNINRLYGHDGIVLSTESRVKAVAAEEPSASQPPSR